MLGEFFTQQVIEKVISASLNDQGFKHRAMDRRGVNPKFTLFEMPLMMKSFIRISVEKFLYTRKHTTSVVQRRDGRGPVKTRFSQNMSIDANLDIIIFIEPTQETPSFKAGRNGFGCGDYC